MSLKNIFQYGQVGTALDGFRESEIAQQSANKLLNFVITEMGTLRVAKQYEKINILSDGSLVQKFLDTKYHFYMIMTSSQIITLDKNTHAHIASLAHGMNISFLSNVSMFNDFFSMVDDSGSCKVFAINPSGGIGTTNFLDTIQLPFLKLTQMSLDYYKVFNPTIGTEKKLSPELMRSYQGDLEVYVKDGKLWIANLDVPVDRIYRSFKAGLTKDDVTDCAEGQKYLIFRNYKAPTGDEKYYAGNNEIAFVGDTHDPVYGSNYFTGASPEGARGILRFGVTENFKPNIVDFLEYQSRLVICTKEKMYFSEVLDYNNFVPGTGSSESFFLKLSPIDGNQPVVMKLTSGNGIYVTAAKGIMVVGYDTHLTPSTSLGSVFIAGNSEPTKASALVENDFYYLDKTGLLRCILLKVSGGKAIYSNEVAEKYSHDRGAVKWVTRGYVNEQNTCVCTGNKSQELFVYARIAEGIFRNYSLEFDTGSPVFGYNENFIAGSYFYRISNKNYKKAKLINNIPLVKSPTKGYFLMDFEMDYSRIVLNILAPGSALKGVKLNQIPFQNLQRSKGDYKIYDYNGTLNIIDLTVDLDTNETIDPVEIKGINYALRGGGL
ncbi:MAG: hypothetical protein ACRDDH_09215 [Cetobacterium sp.]|uniref:hypothetical protein n=1 Tax=Cetobacterium sp. TaxID=2071632 RepID=UPI003EE44987